MCCCRLLNSPAFFVLVLISSFCHGRTLDKNYGVSENSIVATPVGYEKEVTLSNGEVIKLYPDMLSLEEVTNCHAVLFCILSPQKQRGKRFLFQHSGCTCYMCAMPSSVTNLYQIGKCYLFENPHTVSNILLSTYAVQPPTPELKMERDWGKSLYCSIKDVDARIRELEGYVVEDQALLKEYQAQLQQVPNEPSQRKMRHELKCRIFRIEHRLTNDIPNARAELLERRKWLYEQEEMLMPMPNDDAYCDQMLKDTGLDFSQLSFTVEHKFCEDRWIDAQVYFKLKVKGEDTDKITNRLRSFPKYEGGIEASSPPPVWWKPGPSAIKIAYIKNDDDNGTVIVIAYVEPPDNGVFTLYIQVIPF